MRFLALLLFVLLLALAACKTYLLFHPAPDGLSPCYGPQDRIYRNGDVIITTDDYKKTIDTVLTDGVNIKIESIQTHINDFISKGATHIRFYPQSGYDEVELYPLSYRDETDEEMEARIAKRKAWELQQLEYKRQEYVRLKKIFE